jgi:hypothetical protein
LQSQFFENGYTSGMINTNLRDYMSSEVSSAVCNSFFVLLYYAQFVTTVNFFVRYFGVVHSRPLCAREYGGLLSVLLLILAAFFTWDFFLTVPVEGTETVMTDDYVEIFGGGGPNGTDRAELRVCIRADLVKCNIYCIFNVCIKN